MSWVYLVPCLVLILVRAVADEGGGGDSCNFSGVQRSRLGNMRQQCNVAQRALHRHWGTCDLGCRTSYRCHLAHPSAFRSPLDPSTWVCVCVWWQCRQIVPPLELRFVLTDIYRRSPRGRVPATRPSAWLLGGEF